MKEHIFLSSPHMSDEGYEKEYIKEAFDTNWIAPLGKNVTEFENEMKEQLGAKAAVALSAGTAAIHLALKSIGVKQDDIVFCQSLTFSATATNSLNVMPVCLYPVLYNSYPNKSYNKLNISKSSGFSLACFTVHTPYSPFKNNFCIALNLFK